MGMGMNKTNLLNYVNIGNNGSIKLGKNIVVDGYEHGREIGVFTHIHRDHINLFTNAMHECSIIYVSPPTFDLMSALEQNVESPISSDLYFKGRHIHRLDFNEPIVPKLSTRTNDSKNEYSEKITLLRSQHILGSSQVLVNSDDGKSIIYSSDFSYPQTKPIKCDILVLDSTHGHPMFNASIDVKTLENRLVELVEQEIESGKPICIRAHVGRLHDIMSLLSVNIAENISFLAAPQTLKLVPVYRKYNKPIRIVIDSHSYEGSEILENNFPFIEFKTICERKSIVEMDNRAAVFQIGGKYLGKNVTIKQNPDDEKQYFLEMGDHGNYSDILEYVKKCNPQLVVTDSHRSSWGNKLAKNINETLGISAVSQPPMIN